MRKIIFTLLLLISPLLVINASLKYSDSVELSQKYVDKIDNNIRYFVYGEELPWELDRNGGYSNINSNHFSRGGFLNEWEYKVTLSGSATNVSYLAPGIGYWLLSKENYLYVDRSLKIGTASDLYETSVCEFVKTGAYVSGKGTQSSPWEFKLGKNIIVSVNNKNYGSVAPSVIEYVTDTTLTNFYIHPKENYTYDVSDCEDKSKNIANFKYVKSGNYINIKNLISDLRCTIEFIPNIYKITLNKNGGSGESEYIYEKYSVGYYSDSSGNSMIGKVNVPTKDNYTFIGYYTESNGGDMIIDASGNIGNKVDFNKNTTLYAHWKSNTYILTLDVNGGSAWTKYTCNPASFISSSKICKKTITASDVYGTLPVPVKSNSVFDGWYTSASGGTKVSATTSIDHSVPKLYAHYVSSSESVKDFNYTGNVQTFVASASGYYKLEAWGAQGGADGVSGGYGGYSTGYVYLNKNDTIYIVVGGMGATSVANTGGGYNGGGNAGGSGSSGGGGGATHIALKTGLLTSFTANDENLLIVAGGGGGAGNAGANYNGSGGGASGSNGNGTAGTQTSGYAIGKGANKSGDGGGGGGGYYGGSAGAADNNGAGGSGYLNLTRVVSLDDQDKHMTCYNCGGNSNLNYLTSSVSTVSNNAVSDTPKSGNGAARVTFVGEGLQVTNNTKDYACSGVVNIFTAGATGYYKLEAWGAAGGNDTLAGGYGGYSVGVTKLNKGEKLYIQVGCQGGTSVVSTGGGYNGGGNAGTSGASGGGGGATHIATENRGVLSNYSSNKSELLIVAGGGGGGGNSGAAYSGSGGGISGNNGYGTAGTQTTGNAFGQGANKSGDGGGGGGGFYGGSAGSGDNNGGGGSGYIGSSKLISYGNITKHMTCYGCPTSTAEDTYTKTTSTVNVSAVSDNAKSGSGAARITFLGDEEDSLADNDYKYESNIQTYTVAKTGYYKLEVWGASGGAGTTNQNVGSHAGLGGYSVGVAYLTQGTKLYIGVGGQGTYGGGKRQGGYNGGGSCETSGAYCGSGGGATHIATASGTLAQIGSKDKVLIVAGGGGGADDLTDEGLGAGNDGSGGNGGGATSANPRIDGAVKSGYEATQTSGYAFGQGASATVVTDTGGAGGGLYGGKVTNNNNGGAAGGSGFIGNVISYGGIKKHMTCYGCPTNSNNDTYTQSTNKSSEYETSDVAKIGEGAAKIMYLGDGEEIIFAATGNVQEYTALQTGYYQIEAWGASGGGVEDQNVASHAGTGGYSTGVVRLNKDEKLYIYVGSVGYYGAGTSAYGGPTGGYNGGGAAGDATSGSGGGATHVAFTKLGTLNNYSSSRNDVLIVAGGGGGADNAGGTFNGSDDGSGGSGGGYESGLPKIDGVFKDGYQATQSTGYGFGIGAPGSSNTDTGGAGGGWFGGKVTNHNNGGAAGGSGYIGNSRLISYDEILKHMSCYECKTNNSENTLTYSVDSYSSAAVTDKAKIGDGAVKIKFISE